MKNIDLKNFPVKSRKDFVLGIIELLKLTKINPSKIKKLKETIEFYGLKKYEKYFIDNLFKNFNIFNLKKIRYYELILYFEFMQINDFKKNKKIEKIFEKIFDSNIELLNKTLEKCFFELLPRFKGNKKILLKIFNNFGFKYLYLNRKLLKDEMFIFELINNEEIKMKFLENFSFNLDENMKLKLQPIVIDIIMSNIDNKNFDFERYIIAFNLENNIDLALKILEKYPEYYRLFDEDIFSDKRFKNFIMYILEKRWDLVKEFPSFWGNIIEKLYFNLKDKKIINLVNKKIDLENDVIDYILNNSENKYLAFQKLLFNKCFCYELNEKVTKNKAICLKLIQKNLDNIYIIDDSLKNDRNIKQYFKLSKGNIKYLDLLDKIELFPLDRFDSEKLRLIDKSLLYTDKYLIKIIEKLAKYNNLYKIKLFEIIRKLKNIKVPTIIKIIEKFNYYDFRLFSIKELSKNKKLILKMLKFAPSNSIYLFLIKDILDEKLILKIIEILKERDLKDKIPVNLIKPFFNNHLIAKEYIKITYLSEELLPLLNQEQILFYLKNNSFSISDIQIIKYMKKEYRYLAFIKEVIKYKPDELKYANFDLRDNEKIAFLAIRYYPALKKYVSKRIKNKNYITSCIKLTPAEEIKTEY
jgi:hypothetical protein